MKLRRSGFVAGLLFVIGNLLLAPHAGLLRASAQSDGVELAVDLADFNQDGMLVLFGSLQAQGDIGLPVAAGDINGDGKADIISCGMLGSSNSRTHNGVVTFYVSDGRDSGFLDLTTNPPNVFKVVGQRSGDLLGTSASATGDVNGDGITDIAIGAGRHDGPNGDRFNAGATYVVLGSSGVRTNIDLATAIGNPPPGVIVIYGPQVDERFGNWVDQGDLDGDGLADIVIGADQVNSALDHHAGGAYIVFGSQSLPPVIDLASPPAGVRTAKIIGRGTEEHWGAAVQVGDINDDGLGDVLIGGSLARLSATYISPDDRGGHSFGGASNGGTRAFCGEAFVIYGRRNWPLTTDLRTPPASATHVIGAKAGDFLGTQLHSGDINGDGRTDLILGAINGDAPDIREPGAVYIVYGQPEVAGATIDLANVAASGLDVTSIYGEQARSCAGDSVRSFDINGDGFSDLFIGSPNQSVAIGGQTRSRSGDTKIIFGQPDLLPEIIKLYEPPAGLRIFRLAGARIGDQFSYSLWGGDVDGDGYVDYVSNSLHADGFDNLLPSAGNLYIFSGRKLSAKLGLLPPDRPSAPTLVSAQLLSPQGQPVQEAAAGQSGLSIRINGAGFQPGTEIKVNGADVVSRIPSDPGLAATQRTVNLDENINLRNSLGPLVIRARNVQPTPSDLSNAVNAGGLVGPEISSVTTKRKASGGMVLKITGLNFTVGGTVTASANGSPLKLKAISINSSDSASAKIKANSVPPAGTIIQVRVVSAFGIQSPAAAVTAP